MNKSLGIALAFVVAFSVSGVAGAATDPADTHPDLHLIPWPKTLQVGAGHMQLSAERLRSAHQEAGLHVAKCEYLMVTNWGVLNLGSWPCGPIRSRVEHQISHITRLFWLAERSQPGIIRPNRITSPYVVCVASSRGRAPTNA